MDDAAEIDRTISEGNIYLIAQDHKRQKLVRRFGSSAQHKKHYGAELVSFPASELYI